MRQLSARKQTHPLHTSPTLYWINVRVTIKLAAMPSADAPKGKKNTCSHVVETLGRKVNQDLKRENGWKPQHILFKSSHQNVLRINISAACLTNRSNEDPLNFLSSSLNKTTSESARRFCRAITHVCVQQLGNCTSTVHRTATGRLREDE